ncbi:MAG: hypothetical protein ACTS7E_02535 [Arsenophonus sp. NC-CH8-MAG3]
MKRKIIVTVNGRTASRQGGLSGYRSMVLRLASTAVPKTGCQHYR